MPRRLLAALAAAAALAPGCEPVGPKRGPIRGAITLDGAPLASGKVRFFGLTGGISTEGEVQNGRYEIPPGRGPSAGTFRVEVLAERKTGRRVPDMDAPPGVMRDEVVNDIPPRYNRESALKIDYDPAGNTTHDFDLKSK